MAMLVYQRVRKMKIMWVKQCHVYHPWLGMVTIPPVKGGMTGGWCKWHCFTHIKSRLQYYPLLYFWEFWMLFAFGTTRDNDDYPQDTQDTLKKVGNHGQSILNKSGHSVPTGHRGAILPFKMGDFKQGLGCRRSPWSEWVFLRHVSINKA